MTGCTLKQKRNDIQGLRAVAIIGVLLFHLLPDKFKNGYLGVDIFFVLSGYLMSSILSRESSLNFTVVLSFYLRRFKRIVPLYSIMLAVLAITAPYIFLPNDISHFVEEMRWALPFYENMRNVKEKHDYWSEVFNYPVLLHTWSLGVEIQYYCIVPFIMIFLRFGEARGHKIICFVFIILESLYFYYSSSKEASFGHLFARVWQFIIGSLSFELEGRRSDNIEIGKRDLGWLERIPSFLPLSSYFVTISLFVTVVWPGSGYPYIRQFITIATGCSLILGKQTQNWITSNRIMNYIGDLSYLIYLVHWPTIILYKYRNDVPHLTLPDMFNCLLITLSISILLHHSIESHFITESTLFCSIFVATLYASIIFALSYGAMELLSKNAHSLIGGDPESARRLEAIRWNQAETTMMYFKNPNGCERDYEAERWTNFLEEEQLRCISSGNGTAKVLVIGNSYAYRAFPLLHRLFKGRYSQMRMFTKSARVFLTADESDQGYFANLEKKVVENFKPDITFLIEMDSHGRMSDPINGSIETDSITLHIQKAVAFLSEHSRTVVVDQQYVKPKIADGIAYRVQWRLQMGTHYFDDLGISRREYENEFANEIARMVTINQSNVIVNKVQDQLCPGEYCYFVNDDNMHAYYGDTGGHLTSEGLEKLKPGYSKIIEDFLMKTTL